MRGQWWGLTHNMSGTDNKQMEDSRVECSLHNTHWEGSISSDREAGVNTNNLHLRKGLKRDNQCLEQGVQTNTIHTSLSLNVQFPIYLSINETDGILPPTFYQLFM